MSRWPVPLLRNRSKLIEDKIRTDKIRAGDIRAGQGKNVKVGKEDTRKDTTWMKC